MERAKRHLRFSLRTLLLVMAVLACWLVWEMNHVRQRIAMRKQINDDVHISWAYTWLEWCNIPSGPHVDEADIPRIPFWRSWLGDEPVYEIGLPETMPEAEVNRIRKLFPEAQILPGQH